jgi:luciferase family oxidoreductase group 1
LAPDVPVDLPPLSLLELSPVVTGRSSAEALADTTAMAQAADRLGYRRVWVAEHHNMASVASTSPPVLIAHLAAATERIRVGSGGVMLPNHPPLVVAEQFALLEALHPGRIDLGFGRAPGTDQATAAALRRAPHQGAPDDFVHEIQQVWALLGAGPDSPFVATPAPASLPAPWMLGSSVSSAVMAAALGLPYAFAHHFSAENTLPAITTYRERFTPSELAPEPYVLVVSQAVVGDSDEHGRELALPSALQFVDLRRGVRRPMRTVEESREHAWTDEERAFVEHRLSTAAVGSAETVRENLAALATETGADEVMVTVATPELPDRLRTLEALAPVDVSIRSS